MSEYRVCVVSGWHHNSANITGHPNTIYADAYVYTHPNATIVTRFTRAVSHPRAPYVETELTLRDAVKERADAWIRANS